MNTLPPLSDWPEQLRALAGLFTAIALFGFICGFLFLDVTTHLTPDGIITHYNGLPEAALDAGGELKFEKSLKDMLTTTHNHVLGLAGPFFLIGFLYLLCGPLNRRRTMVALEPLCALPITFGGIWIVRFVYPPFAYLVMLSGILMVGSYVWMSLVILRACMRISRSNN